MSANVEQLEREVLALPPEERARLTDKLWASLEDSTCLQISREWMDEIERRCKEIDQGRVEMIPGEQVLREAQELLDRSRPKR
jgi:putative addiction module component (TIGR02574 family)